MDDIAIIKFYEGCGSIRETANAAKINPQAVRRILIAHGMHSNQTHSAVSDLAAQGLSAAHIADRLHIARATVYTYLPYTKGRYKVDEPTANALRIRATREKRKEDNP